MAGIGVICANGFERCAKAESQAQQGFRAILGRYWRLLEEKGFVPIMSLSLTGAGPLLEIPIGDGNIFCPIELEFSNGGRSAYGDGKAHLRTG